MKYKQLYTFTVLLFCLFVLFYLCKLIYNDYKFSHEWNILIVVEPSLMKKSQNIINAYKSVLEEEGVPYKVVDATFLLSTKPEDIVNNIPAIIFPDDIAQILPEDMKFWVKKYLSSGGNTLLVYNPGIMNIGKFFREEALFSDLIGVNHLLYSRLRGDAFTRGDINFIEFKKYSNKKPVSYTTQGNIEFIDHNAANYFQIPAGKIYEGKLLSGYSYGKLEYPISRCEIKNSLNTKDIYAYALTNSKEKIPAIILKKNLPGALLYINFPLGFLKSYSDDLPLRAVLRTFLFKISKLPHFLPVPFGKAGIVFNWHIDANLEWKTIPFMLKENYLRNDIEYSLHITAGDFRDTPGDKLGFDADNKGKEFVKMLLNYGVIGSHGGWAHNWFASNIMKGVFGEEKVTKYIKKNNETLENITGYKITEFSAPQGVHPQPVMTKVLEKLGFNSYYYTGDSGSSPNRTFINGKMISDKVIAFPIIPFEKSASLYEMSQAGKTQDEVKNWFISNIIYCIQNKTIMLMYSHPYDIFKYPESIKTFLDYTEAYQKEGILQIKPMSYFAKFMLKYLKTEHTFKIKKNFIKISLKNQEDLDGITFVVPKDKYKVKQTEDIIVEDNDNFYIMIKDNKPKGTIHKREFTIEMLNKTI